MAHEKTGERFPMMASRDYPPGWIPWDLAKIVYDAYVKLHGNQQTIERIAERGGFYWDEATMFLTTTKGGS